MNREILPILIIALMFALALYVEPYLKTDCNGNVIGHWGMSGKPDGWVDKSVGLYLVPAMTAIIYLVFLIIPKIEVYKKNLEDFSLQFWGFKVVFVFMMGVIYVATLLPNMGYAFDTVPVVVAAIAMLFFYTGYMLNYTKRNYFIGMRTPWTLADERVWDKTNRLAGKLFWACGALCLVALVTPPDVMMWMVIGPAIAAAIVATAYSYVEYNKAKNETVQKPRKKARKR